MPQLDLFAMLAIALFALTGLLLVGSNRLGQTRLGLFLAVSSFASVAGAGYCMLRAYMGESAIVLEQADAAERRTEQRPGATDASQEDRGSSGDAGPGSRSSAGAADGGANDAAGGSFGSGLGRPRQAFPATLQQSGTKASNVIVDCEQCPEMIMVDAGFFRMGAAADDQDAEPSEHPARMVSVPRRFAISRGEVTVGQFMAFVHATGRTVADCLGVEPGRPAACVSWHDAVDYMDWLRAVTGKTYRLPSEIEWEWAARGGSAERYVSGKEPAFRRSNAFGLINVHGGVAEIAGGCWLDTLKEMSADALRPARGGNCMQRPLRDAAQGERIGLARLSARRPIGIDERRAGVGFRIARSP